MTTKTTERPPSFSMKIHPGMLETMGHNMYTSIAKCLAEFVANAYDADAEKVQIALDFDKVSSAKKIVREKAREDKKAGLRDDSSAVYDSLPSDITITIHDDGHGMDANEIQDLFLAVTRNRRKDNNGKLTKHFTESGKRRVMGRKGVGKLAGFGAAEHIKVTSKRKGQNYSTTFEMDYAEIQRLEDLGQTRFNAKYIDNQPIDDQYTTITLSNLRCDSMKSSEVAIIETLARTFCIRDKNFNILLNGQVVEDTPIEWEFTFPVGASEEKMGTAKVIVDLSEEDGNYEINYLIRFRARPNDHNADQAQAKKRASLPAERRGARIYSHGRLTHGPSLLKLHSGVHNFHAQDYMECIVLADKVDEYDNDYIVTSRANLQEDNPIIEALFITVTDLMIDALKEHYKQRDAVITKAIEDDEYSNAILSPLQNLNKKSQRAAKEILKVVGREHGLKSSTYREMAPILLQAVNASDVLTKLIQLETDPKSIHVLAHSMAELTKMEKSDLLKLYRGRSAAINALQKLHEDSLTTKKGKGYENDLHQLFKDSPWLIKPEYASYITSDKPMGDVCKTLNQKLGIDSVVDPKTIKEDDTKRPDLVFLAINATSPDIVVIVELKSPGIEMNNDHITQLKGYQLQVEEYLREKLNKEVKTQGFLIGTIPDSKTTSMKKKLLLNVIKESSLNDNYQIIDILTLITTAKDIHASGIRALEAEEKQLEEELS